MCFGSIVGGGGGGVGGGALTSSSLLGVPSSPSSAGGVEEESHACCGAERKPLEVVILPHGRNRCRAPATLAVAVAPPLLPIKLKDLRAAFLASIILP